MAIADYYYTIQIHTGTRTANGRGGFSTVWAMSSEFEGVINQASSREVEAAAKLDIKADYKLFCPVGTVLSNKKLLYYDGNYYRIVSEPKNTVGRDHHYKIFLKRTEGAAA